jgi:hypothetical protein
MNPLRFEVLFIFAASLVSALSAPSRTDPQDYGVDITFPMHHSIEGDTHYARRYRKLMQGCYDTWSQEDCDRFEDFRMEMAREQPPTQHNYT